MVLTTPVKRPPRLSETARVRAPPRPGAHGTARVRGQEWHAALRLFAVAESIFVNDCDDCVGAAEAHRWRAQTLRVCALDPRP
eukprot:1595297-Rhodomonas_salina.2